MSECECEGGHLVKGSHAGDLIPLAVGPTSTPKYGCNDHFRHGKAAVIGQQRGVRLCSTATTATASTATTVTAVITDTSIAAAAAATAAAAVTTVSNTTAVTTAAAATTAAATVTATIKFF